jgi:hypothetical protein
MIVRMRRLGVDVGGVIIEPADEDDDTSFFGAHYLRTPPVDGAFEALAALVDEVFGDQVHVVSKCGEATERRTREWLAHHDFFTRTGIGSDRLHFCRTRPEKAPIAERLGLTHFVDDRLEVLGYLGTVEHRYLFHPRDAEVARHAAHLPAVHRVETWPELLATLRAR